MNYLSANTPLRGTSFEYMLTGVYYGLDGEQDQKFCLPGPIVEIDQAIDTMISLKNCKNVHRYLTEDKFDVEGLEKLLIA